MLSYRETCDYLFTKTPQFEKTGASAYKPGLGTSLALDEHLGHPHEKYRTIHVAGTNGKGSTCHTLAAILQKAGYKVGLFTSPHLVDFRERIKVNGEMCSEKFVVDFVEKHRAFFEPLQPSFFEITTAMALEYFYEKEVDVAVIEVGLGGRLDCTNIITPDLCIITNISLDHTDLLGDTQGKIAAEKAGIMKKGVPCIIGETSAETLPVFESVAREKGCQIIKAEEFSDHVPQGELTGEYQKANLRTILCAVEVLNALPYYTIGSQMVAEGIQQVCSLTGLRGRWETLDTKPLTICDVGHNPGAWQYLGPRLKALGDEKLLHIVIGMCEDKDVCTVLSLMPKDVRYYWTAANSRRAISPVELKKRAETFGLQGETYGSVADAYDAAREKAGDEGAIFVGGSCYVVAELLRHRMKKLNINIKK